jgi:hypothetical protein
MIVSCNLMLPKAPGTRAPASLGVPMPEKEGFGRYCMCLAHNEAGKNGETVSGSHPEESAGKQNKKQGSHIFLANEKKKERKTYSSKFLKSYVLRRKIYVFSRMQCPRPTCLCQNHRLADQRSAAISVSSCAKSLYSAPKIQK